MWTDSSTCWLYCAKSTPSAFPSCWSCDYQWCEKHSESCELEATQVMLLNSAINWLVFKYFTCFAQVNAAALVVFDPIRVRISTHSLSSCGSFGQGHVKGCWFDHGHTAVLQKVSDLSEVLKTHFSTFSVVSGILYAQQGSEHTTSISQSLLNVSEVLCFPKHQHRYARCSSRILMMPSVADCYNTPCLQYSSGLQV